MARSQGVVGWHSMRKDDFGACLAKTIQTAESGSRPAARFVGTKPGPTANGSARQKQAKIFAID